jgi:UPF0271 protein
MRVLDTSAVLRSDLDFSKGSYALTPAVLGEIKSGIPAAAVENAIRTGSIKIRSPSQKAVNAASEAAKKTGDLEWLSAADLEALALAIEKRAVICSDDYGIQNAAKELGVKYETATQEGITEKRRWVKRCEGCGKTHPPGQEKTCSVCGGALKKKRAGDG